MAMLVTRLTHAGGATDPPPSDWSIVRLLTRSKAPPEWASRLVERRSVNVAAVALANKTARTIWALLAHDRAYQANFVSQPA